MSIVSGLVGTEHSVTQHRSAAGEWMLRNAWGLILTGSAVFWLALAYALIGG